MKRLDYLIALLFGCVRVQVRVCVFEWKVSCLSQKTRHFHRKHHCLLICFLIPCLKETASPQQTYGHSFCRNVTHTHKHTCIILSCDSNKILTRGNENTNMPVHRNMLRTCACKKTVLCRNNTTDVKTCQSTRAT